MPLTKDVTYLVHRIQPHESLKQSLISLLKVKNINAAFVISCVGSLDACKIRFAKRKEETIVDGPLEIITLNGTVSSKSAHLHISVSDSTGKLTAGHLCDNSNIRTTCEILLACLNDIKFERVYDKNTGFKELYIAKKGL